MDWFAGHVSEAIAALGLLMSGLALRYTHRIDARQRGVDRPTATVSLQEHEQAPGWLWISITVRNGTDAEWILHTITIRPRRSARIFTDELDPLRDAGPLAMLGPRLEFAAELEANAQPDSAPIFARISPAGSETRMGRGLDAAHLSAFVKLERPVRSISIRLKLRSTEAMERLVTITSRRDVRVFTQRRLPARR